VEEPSLTQIVLLKERQIEVHLDKAKGPAATLLMQNGTRVADILWLAWLCGKVRAMVDDRGRRVEAAIPVCGSIRIMMCRSMMN